MTTYSLAQVYQNALGRTFDEKWLNHPTTSSKRILAHLIFKGDPANAALALRSVSIHAAKPKEELEGIRCWELFQAAIASQNVEAMPFARSSLGIIIGTQKLRLLHLAVIAGRKELVETLVDLVDPDKQDFHGWTAAHHAAIRTDRSIYDLLIAKNAAKPLLNDRNGTPDDMYAMTHVSEANLDGDLVKVYDHVHDCIKYISGREYTDLTGCRYIETNYIAPADAAVDWVEADHNPKYYGKIDRELSEKLNVEKPQQRDLYISDIHTLDDGRKVTNIGWGLYANEDIPAGAYVCAYGGEFIGDRKTENGEYKMDSFDGNGPSKLRGLGCLAADSFPNISTQSLFKFRGYKKAISFISLVPIKKKEPIVINYGGHLIKALQHVEFREHAMKDFFRAHSIASCFKKCASFQDHNFMNYDTETYMKLEKIMYVANTPTSLIKLIISEDIPTKDVRLLFSQPMFARNMEFPLNVLDKLDQIARNQNKELIELFRKFMMWRSEMDDPNALFNYIIHSDILLPRLAFTLPFPKEQREVLMRGVTTHFCNQINASLQDPTNPNIRSLASSS